MRRNSFLLLPAFIFLSSTLDAQKFEHLALTPPMGWNSWNTFACNVDEHLIRGMADAVVSSGMRDAGYRFIVIDDCWHGERDSLGFIHADPQRFPSGMKALGDYIHSKGLKFGIYSCAGAKTCGGRPGGRGHEYQDALTYASWGVDYLKYDWCNTDGLSAVGAYTTMRDALFAAGRPVVFSLCEWGNNNPWLWGKDVGHLWRTTGDITDCFDCEVNHGTWSSWGIMRTAEMRRSIRQYAGPGHWNDPDMLEVGRGMSTNENRTHFSLWCMLAAPLMAGNDLRSMTPVSREILTNREVIAVDQDSLGIEGFCYMGPVDSISTIKSQDSIEVWVKPLTGDDWAVCFINRSAAPVNVDFDWSKHRIDDGVSKQTLDASAATYNIRNLWTGKEEGTTKKHIVAGLGPHDVLMLRLMKR